MKSEREKVRRRVFALERRADHLAKRIAAAIPKDLSYDKQELGALRWAASHLRKLFGECFREEKDEREARDA